ncbi:3-phenylpropionate/cinnamic acid dioxygenase small subunit [Marmoricola sp. URHA0025 HA25]
MDTDREQIVEALAAVAAALDSRDWDALRGWFTHDTHAYGVRGQDALVEQIQAHLGGVGPTQHLLGNHRVAVDGDSARSRTYGRVHHVGAGPMDGSSYECMGEYDDQWVRTDAGWRISRRWFEIQISLGDVAVLRPAGR